MKNFLLIVVLAFCGLTVRAQDDGAGEKMRDRMKTYIQDKLGLSRDEAEKFTPVFIRYFREFRQIRQENRDDNLVLKQKIIDLRIRYRNEFRNIMDEKKANKVYVMEDEFRRKVIAMTERQKERIENATNKKNLQ